MEHSQVESMWFELKTKLSPILININYRSERESHINYWQLFESMIAKALDENSRIICLGDLNKNFMGQLSNNVNDIFSINGLTNIINKPTHFDSRTGNSSLLDPILITENVPLIDSDTIHIDRKIRDHEGTCVTIRCGYSNLKSYQRTVWDYKRADFQLMKQKITAENWEILIQNGRDMNIACTNFTKAFLDISELCIPKWKVTIRSNDKIWFDSILRKEIRKRDRLRKKYLLIKNESSKELHKRQRNLVNNKKKQAKEKFYANVNDNLSDLKTVNSKLYYKTINMLLKSERPTNDVPPLRNPNDIVTSNLSYEGVEKCEILNKYSCSITDLEDDGINLPYFDDRGCNTLTTIVVSEQDVIDVLNILDPNKAVGPDIISNKMLIAVKNEVAKPLSLLFNKSFQCKIFPNNWKIAFIIPLFKRGDKSLPSNYRPVSLLSCVSKCIEKIAFKYIFNHLIFNRLLYKFQSGFIPGYSTTHQLVELYHNILLALDNKEMTSITFADVSKAFDRVWIRGLILKLERYGVKGELLCWLKSYLSNRCQRVIIKDAISSVGEFKAGVPQGSVLGPLLFLIFINDIADDMLGLGRLFADDTSIGHTAHDENTLKNMINIDPKYIQKWS